jgi:glycosyltransferase involved in cell wall biosynthesis
MESVALFRKGYSMYQKFGNMYRRYVVPRVLKKAEKIITVSNFERERIKDFFGLPNEKIVAIYNGVGTHFKIINDVEKLKNIRKKYLLPEKYFFFLGNTDPKKNTKGVLKAYSDYVKQKGNSIKLLMLDYEEAELMKLLNEINAQNIRNDIYLAGYVNNNDLPAIYNMAELFLYPSMRESFGIPMLEAMACGTAVITSNTSSMPEVANGAAKIINPSKTIEITNAIIELLENDNLRNTFIKKGVKRASEFSWKLMAEQNLKLYKEVLNSIPVEEKYGVQMMFI